MRPLPELQVVVLSFAFCCTALFATAQPVNLQTTGLQTVDLQTANVLPVVTEWSSTRAQHVYGLPGAKAKESGTLRIHGGDLLFAGKTSSSTIGLPSIYAVGAGNERVELWGVKGRILRMAIPNGGGLFAATFMHHRVDMFTVEFGDQDGGYHTAVFYLPANEAQRALQVITASPMAHREPTNIACGGSPVNLSSVRVPLPTWNDADAPAAYRALVYEHLIDRLRQSPGIDRVYRDGEPGCPQYTVQLTATGFKAGSQIARASTGPVGMFVGTTQMGFDMRILDARGQEVDHDRIKATVRGESESINVSQSVAKKIAKEFAASQTRSQHK